MVEKECKRCKGRERTQGEREIIKEETKDTLKKLNEDLK